MGIKKTADFDDGGAAYRVYDITYPELLEFAKEVTANKDFAMATFQKKCIIFNCNKPMTVELTLVHNPDMYTYDLCDLHLRKIASVMGYEVKENGISTYVEKRVD